MKKTLTFLSLLAFGLLFISGLSEAQIRTGRGDFFNITRTVEQTADSVTFVADTLTVLDSGAGLGNFQNNDSVAVMFVQNRFKIVNNMIGTTQFDYIRVQVRNNTGMTLARQTYNGVVTNVTGGIPFLGTDPGQTGPKIGLRPVYRPVGAIASSSVFNSDPSAIRQLLTFRVINPSAGVDGVQIRNIFFKPNINNLTGLAMPPDTTKDTLRAYHLDGNLVSAGDVMSQTDLAIVRLLPGTTRILMWVKDSAQAVDAGEYIGSFGDYSRGRYFLGDDGLPMADTRTMRFRPSATNPNWGPGAGNPDQGMVVDGFPPERNPLKLTALYQALAPFWYTNQFPSNYPAIVGDPCGNPNPENGLIPPYRVGEYAIAHDPYQPGLVTSALDTLRFFDAWGNRTWDRVTQPKLKALAYTLNTIQPDDRTRYLTGYTAADDTLRQYGQIVYRRLAYTHADVGVNAGGVQDSVRILATAQVKYLGLGSVPQTLNALPDTSGGFPRTWNGIWNPDQNNPLAADYIPNMHSEYRNPAVFPGTNATYDIDFRLTQRQPESANDGDLASRVPVVWTVDENRTPVDPSNWNSLPFSGVKITVRPNIPRAIDIRPSNPWAGTNGAQFLRLDITEVDGYGNTVDDNEKFKFELSPFGHLSTGLPYRLNGVFDSLVATQPSVAVSGMNLDSGRVSVGGVAIGTATRVLRPATGSNNVGPYRVRVRSTWSFPDRNGMATDLHFPLKLDPYPVGQPATIGGFSHANIIPDGSPNNNFGVWFGPNALMSCALNPPPQMNAGFGNSIGQTTAMDSTDVVWDGDDWIFVPGRQPKVELVCGGPEGDALVVGSVGGFTLPGQPKDIDSSFYVRITDVFGNPMNIEPYFYPNPNKVQVELPSNPYYIYLFTHPDPNIQIDKVFFGSVSPNVAFGGAGNMSNPTNINARFNPVNPANPNDILEAELVTVPAGGTLPFVSGDIPALAEYSAVRFFVRAPENVKTLSLAGTDTMQVRAHLTLASIPNAGDVSISSGLCAIPIIPDVVSSVEVFKSNGKPAGAPVPMPWAPGDPNDFAADYYPAGTPMNAAQSDEFYNGYFFRALTANPPSTDGLFPSPIEPGGNIGGFQADDVSLDGDATAPIPLDTVTVSEHSNQIRLVARLLDQYRNPVGGRLVKFHVESETLPITWPKTSLQNNAQRGGFGEFGQTIVSDDTLRRTTIGDTAQAGWVTAFFNSGRVGWQIVRVALTPDTLAFDLSNIGRNLGEGTIVGPSNRGYAPRVIIPIYQRPDTTVRVEIFPYTAGVSSPIPLPADLVPMLALEHPSVYFRAGEQDKWSPFFQTYAANPHFIEERGTRYGRMANTNIRPYIPDTLNMTESDPMNVNTITAGRKILLLAREYDKFGNLVDNSTDLEDTARVRFRMWSGSWGAPVSPYNTTSYIGGTPVGGGTIVPCGDWVEDSYGPMRKIRVRHTQISNLVAGVHINQTGFFTALEFPTPKLTNSDFFFEATVSGVLPGQGAVNIDRDTTKVVAVVKDPTRFDVLRAGQEYPRGSYGIFPLTGPADGYPPNGRRTTGPANIALPAGTDVDNHWLDAVGVDNILVSQVYRRNVSPGIVGKYEIVDENNVPLDVDGDPLFTGPNQDFNPDFEVNEYSGLREILHLNAHNNQNPFTSPNVSYNILNGNAPPGFSMPNGYRNDGVIFEVSIAGGGDGIGANIAPGDRRPVLFRVTPIWENNPPTGGNPYDLTMFTGNNAQPGQVRAYPNDITSESTRLYADTIYTYEGTFSSIPNKATDTRAEIMGTRSDRGFAGRYTAGTEFDRVTRVGLSTWGLEDWDIAGFPRNPADLVSQFRTRTGAALIGGETAQGLLFNGDYNRRVALLGPPPGQPRQGSFSRETTAPGYIAPGAHLRLMDSTAGQVLDLRIVAPDIMDMAGNPVDDTASYDQGKYTIVRRAHRVFDGYWQYDDTYYNNNPADIQGPNYTTSSFVAENPYTGKGRPTLYYTINANNASVLHSFFGPTSVTQMKHTFVMIPYRIAYLSLFPSSYDVSQGTNLLDQLPLGIVPRQADIDTLPRVQLVPPLGADLTKWEMFTRLYGQIVHGATQNQIPSNQGPYARPDTIYRDLIYTYAVTPYDRYGNLNVRDTMFVQVGARSTDWDFLDLQGADPQLMVRSGGVYFRTIPRNTPTSENYRHDTLRLFNPIPTSSSSRNAYLGIKPDDKRLGLLVGEPGGANIPHGLLPANVISSRPVDVKRPFRPADFTLNQPGLQNRDLFRIDYVGCAPMYVPDTLRLFWQESEWDTQNAGRNNPNDTIKYEWYAIIDSVGANGAVTTRTVSMLADNDGKDNMITIDGETLRELIFRPNTQPQPNADSLVMRLKWYVRAFSKTGLEAFSDTAGATVRNQPPPTPGLIVSINRPPVGPMDPQQPANNSVIGNVSPTSGPIDFIWNTATDINITKGNLIGGFKTYNAVTQQWETVLAGNPPMPARTVDTILYQFVGFVVNTFPQDKGATHGTVIVKNADRFNAIQLTDADKDALFAGFSTDTLSTSADSVTIEWYVIAKDFGFDDDGPIPFPYKEGIYDNDSLALNNAQVDTSTYSWTSCQPHWIRSGPYTVHLTKLDNGGVEIDPSQATASGAINKVVGEEVCFTLVAKDGNGNIIRDWDVKGSPTTLTLNGSTANTDTSTATWNSDPDGYTYAVIQHNGQPLTYLPPDQWTIPPDAFVNGVATICLIHTKADSNVTITVTPQFGGLNQVSATMHFTADAVSNYLVEITSATAVPDQVYQLRKYEIVVSPRDRYLNVSNQQVKTYFSARFPGEFDNSQPGFAQIFAGAVFIQGPTNFFVASTEDRVKNVVALQQITAYSDGNLYKSSSNPYEILTHEPQPFDLQQPPDQTVLQLSGYSAPYEFNWTVSTDPYTNIQISRFTSEIGNDIVTYEIYFVDSTSLTKKVVIDSDNLGLDNKFTTTHGQIKGITDQIAGGGVLYQPLVWKVKATDGLYETWSTPDNADPRPGFRLSIDNSVIVSVDDPQTPSSFALEQNFPNPFNPTTTVSYSVPSAGQVNVMVFDLLGNHVKTLVNEVQEPGSYKVVWDATDDQGQVVPTGNYILKMVAGDFSQTRKMTLLK